MPCFNSKKQFQYWIDLYIGWACSKDVDKYLFNGCSDINSGNFWIKMVFISLIYKKYSESFFTFLYSKILKLNAFLAEKEICWRLIVFFSKLSTLSKINVLNQVSIKSRSNNFISSARTWQGPSSWIHLNIRSNKLDYLK